jgi:hypothetical protein
MNRITINHETHLNNFKILEDMSNRMGKIVATLKIIDEMFENNIIAIIHVSEEIDKSNNDLFEELNNVFNFNHKEYIIDKMLKKMILNRSLVVLEHEPNEDIYKRVNEISKINPSKNELIDILKYMLDI